MTKICNPFATVMFGLPRELRERLFSLPEPPVKGAIPVYWWNNKIAEEPYWEHKGWLMPETR